MKTMSQPSASSISTALRLQLSPSISPPQLKGILLRKQRTFPSKTKINKNKQYSVGIKQQREGNILLFECCKESFNSKSKTLAFI